MSDNGTSGTGNSHGGGPLSTGGPLGGPGRPGKRLMPAMQDSGIWTGPGVPHGPHREVTSQKTGAADRRQNPHNPPMKESTNG